ncbi:hypothetical protein [Acetonema longum]|uniref:Uncharacterized protein n=1 Tax=Acetonema longum DSM 6540 TaxID=1009370 RepID=F7NMP2_9FIRM|nr:hypothetical protein [Acetonema longum]EGO62688.1 hypothetical protein ALO_16866 [Acetonema longum DSM 6540]
MLITLDISNEEFDAVIGDIEITPVIFLDFPSDIRGVYEFELLNSVVNIFHFKDQILSQGVCLDDTVLIFGKMKVRIEKVKGADFELVEGDYHTGRKQYHTWSYTLNKGDVVCTCVGSLSFLADYCASIYIVTESNPKITLTFDTEETVPYDTTNPNSTKYGKSKVTKYEHTSSPGKLFDHEFFQEHLKIGRIVIKDEKG